MTGGGELLVIETTGAPIHSVVGIEMVATVEVRAIPYNSNNMIKEIRFTSSASKAPRVGDVLKVTIEGKDR